jgi:succinoglycan biosynthesis transport protein ExoP
MDDSQRSMEVDYERLLGLVRRRALLLVFCAVLVGLAAFGFSKLQTKEYTATATLVFNNNQTNQQAAGLQAVAASNQQAQQNTNIKLVQLGDMAEKSAARLGSGLTRAKILENLSVGSQGESNIVTVSSTAASPILAADIANTYTHVFVAEQQSANHAYYASALALVNKQLASLSPRERTGTAGLALEGRAQSLGVLAELRSSTVQIVQAATIPTGPSSPKVSRNTALGVALGLLLGFGAAFLLERFDRRIREPKDLESIYGLPLLGVVPESSALSRSSQHKSEARAILPASEAEAFHLIRAHLRYFNVDRDLRTLMIVSAAPGDGKTTVARHLATAAAHMGSSVLLIECDLRRPTLAQQLEIPSGPGLADVLINTVSLSEATQSIDLGLPLGGNPETRRFDVLVAGAVLPPNPGELIESHSMEDLLRQTRSKYDLVVIDTPPLTAVSDAFPLLRKVDGIIIVGRVGRNRRDIAARLHETLTGVGAPLLGVVANGLKIGRSGSYGYSYDYAPSGPEASPPTSPPSSISTNSGSSTDVPASHI